MSVRFLPAAISGAGMIVAPFLRDDRGSFNKPFSAEALTAAGIDFPVGEVYWSSSAAGVVRGLHLQLPPAAHAKFVFVTSGAVRDFALDLRRGSPTYGRWAEHELRPGSGAALVPIGFAHGFEVLEGPATFVSIQSGPYDGSCERGVRWDSTGISWATAKPTVSAHDAALPSVEDFDSPFVFEA